MHLSAKRRQATARRRRSAALPRAHAMRMAASSGVAVRRLVAGICSGLLQTNSCNGIGPRIGLAAAQQHLPAIFSPSLALITEEIIVVIVVRLRRGYRGRHGGLTSET